MKRIKKRSRHFRISNPLGFSLFCAIIILAVGLVVGVVCLAIGYGEDAITYLKGQLNGTPISVQASEPPTAVPTDTPAPTEIPFSYYAPTVNMSFEELVGSLDDFNEADPNNESTFRLPAGYPSPDKYYIIVDLYWQRSDMAISETDKKYGRYCHTIAYHICNDNEDAEECVNDTWFRAWNAMPTDRPNILATFLGRITRNLAISLCRSKYRVKRGGGEMPLALEELDEAASLKNISFMPARVKCAVLGWHTMEEMLKNGESEGRGKEGHCTTENL